MANYNTLKNAAILNPVANTDLGSPTNAYNNLYMSGNINFNGTSLNSTNAITPRISSLTYLGDDTAANPAGGQTVTINGSGFATGAAVYVGGSIVNVVTVVNSSTITFVSPVKSAGNYALLVLNTDGASASFISGIQYSGVPTWSTAAGSLGSVTQSTSFSSTLTATSDSTVSYSVFSGALPSGITMNTTTGVISGTAPTVSGSTTYNFTIRATDGENQDTDRAFSLTVTVVIPNGQQEYTTAGTYSWTAPALVTAVSVVAIGGGGGGGAGSSTGIGGGGGGLGWKNNIAVTPGQTYTVVVGAGGGGGSFATGGADSYFLNTSTVAGNGGSAGRSGFGNGAGGSRVGDGGGNGGSGNTNTGGGGAGGYAGNGGNGSSTSTGNSGSGGAAGSGVNSNGRSGGGGVGILGQGANGGATASGGGLGGSGGSNGSEAGSGGNGGIYGGGGGTDGPGGKGAVRIIWGSGRAFPSTLTTTQS